MRQWGQTNGGRLLKKQLQLPLIDLFITDRITQNITRDSAQAQVVQTNGNCGHQRRSYGVRSYAIKIKINSSSIHLIHLDQRFRSRYIS